MFEPTELTNSAVIKVIGVDDGGGNAVEHTMREHIESVEFFAANTDAQMLYKVVAGQIVQIGNGITRGLSAGANPEVSRNAADEDREALRAALDGIDTVFITVGMSGGISTGAVPMVAEVAKDLGILTAAVVTKSSNFEDKKRMAFTEQDITELSKHVDFLITIPNDKLLKMLDRGTFLLDALGTANNVLKGVVQDIAGLTTRPGLMNADFMGVRTVMSEMGYAMMGSDVASGENHTGEAAEMVISSPLLEDVDLSGVHGVLINIITGFDLRLDELETVSNAIRTFALGNTTAVIGTSLDPGINDELRVTVATTGISMDRRPEITLVANEQAQQPVMDRYQQHDMAPLTQEQKPVAKVVNDNVPQATKESDYLDIPVFLYKQAN